VGGLLRDYELKRGRAMLHFQAIRESIEHSTNVDLKPVPGEVDRDAGKHVFHVPLKPIDPAWALLVGDFIYDTRASLDYLITALIRSTGQEENETSQFPIYRIEAHKLSTIDQRWEKDARCGIKGNLKGTPTGTKAALKQLQPFYGVPVVNPFRHPLYALHVLSNRDKHRRLNLLARVVSSKFVDAAGKKIFEGPPQSARIPKTHEGDAYTVTLSTRDKLDVDMYLLPTYDIRLNEPPQLVGNLIDTLAGINEFIDTRVLPTVRALL